jgi:hypothetical protein
VAVSQGKGKDMALEKERECRGSLVFFLCREVMVGSAGDWRRGAAKEAKNGSRGVGLGFFLAEGK